jgi:hypothetical protein
MELVRDLADLAKTITSHGATRWEDAGLRREIGRIAAEFDALWALTKRNISQAQRSGLVGPGGSAFKLAFTELRNRLGDLAMHLLDRASLSLDDSGTEATGHYQAGATVSVDNPFGLNELFYVSANHSIDGHGFGNPERAAGQIVRPGVAAGRHAVVPRRSLHPIRAHKPPAPRRPRWRELGETGVFSLTLPEADGGLESASRGGARVRGARPRARPRSARGDLPRGAVRRRRLGETVVGLEPAEPVSVIEHLRPQRSSVSTTRDPSARPVGDRHDRGTASVGAPRRCGWSTVRCPTASSSAMRQPVGLVGIVCRAQLGSRWCAELATICEGREQFGRDQLFRRSSTSVQMLVRAEVALRSTPRRCADGRSDEDPPGGGRRDGRDAAIANGKSRSGARRHRLHLEVDAAVLEAPPCSTRASAAATSAEAVAVA